MISCLISDMISQVDEAEKELKMKIRAMNGIERLLKVLQS